MQLEDVKTIFTQSVSSSVWWKKFKGSEFVTYLTLFVAQVAIRSRSVSERLLQEGFISLAVTPSAILAHAQSRGYVATKRIPTTHTISLFNKSQADESVVAGTSLYCSENNNYYLVSTSVIVPFGSAVQVECIQAVAETFSSTVNVMGKFTTKELGVSESKEISSFKVYVTEPDGTRLLWDKTHLFRNTNATSLAYVEYFTEALQIGIRFGNGISGKMPAAGSIVDVECEMTEGFTELPVGAKFEFDEDLILKSKFDVSVVNTVVIGSEREGIESIRLNAQYAPIYDDNLVFDNDYPFFIKERFKGLTWLKVWGESEQEKLNGSPNIAFINKIYVSAYHPSLTQAEVMATISRIFSGVNALNESYVPTVCKELTYTVAVTGKTLSVNSPTDVEVAILDILRVNYAKTSITNKDKPTLNSIYKAIEALQLLYDFDVTVAGADLSQIPPIDSFLYLDVDSSTVAITY